ncbi:heterokaryon incompatibility protein-domain-containing protein [Boeremia exigua]|uniref:heterokaryon incompatibility protein-domain-containing protein n=1 Tax=Boeremia exigua TaxID=749465 RepID=UPI001E8CA8CC|nr:heterokaryon incompatibility protein-domain-containing protein [Boeremia exigua]KAH6621768.1 heterokaryon incompatibility protein-domain-containing protein [Boeremia exigua]
MTLANRWMFECKSSHYGTCKDEVRKLSMGLNVIDCATRTLCVLPENRPYVCLSYVWGLASSNDSSQVDLHDLPRTMKDAIHVTVRLGMRYLWIDRYCIDQANAAEKHDAISNMGVIYQGAAVTIIAAAGVGPHAGLPGIGETPLIEEDVMSINGKPHAAFPNPRLEISEATWSTRGWTYQEMLLSRRRLVFTPSQLYFQCNDMHCGNFMLARFAEATGSSAPARAFPQMQNASAENYIFDRLQEYYIRRLSYPSDIVKAFMGVIGAFSLSRHDRNLRASQFYGIPILYFDADEADRKYPVANRPAMPRTTFLTGLAWSISGTEQWPLQTTNDDMFPSWTWASVKSNRGDSDCGNLMFPITSQSDYGSNTRVYMHHRSQGRRELRGHVDEWSRHEAYHPWIDLESWTAASALIPEPGIGQLRSYPLSYRMSGFKGGTLSFDYGVQNQAVATVTVVLLGGGFHLHTDPDVAIFLVLEDVGGGLHRRIGLYTSARHEREFAMDRLAKMMTPRFAVQKRSASLDEQNRSEAARERLVQEERTWQRRVVRVI